MPAQNLFEKLLEEYNIRRDSENFNAIREIMQNVALAGLDRGGFFDKAAFYGGTYLRIVHKLDRFSEDMDFTLLESNPDFTLEPYFDAIVSEFALIGHEVEIKKKEKMKSLTAIDSAFLKDNTRIYDLTGNLLPSVKIKIEVDTDPPGNFGTEYNPVFTPYPFTPRCYTLPSAYAGKMSALIYRKWRNRVKGRDWFDFEWYVSKDIEMDLTHYNERILQFGHVNSPITAEEFKETLREKIKSTDIARVKEDVEIFIEDSSRLDIWTTDYFLKLTDMMRIR
jgi:predicted nucleotidyltransferase component of viral defense system